MTTDAGDVLSFDVAGPPVPCERPRFARGRTYLPSRSRKYQAHVKACGELAAAMAAWEPDTSHRYAITLVVYRQALRGDWDNYAKSICDGLKGVAWVDDRQVLQAAVRLDVDRVAPRVTVRVERIV